MIINKHMALLYLKGEIVMLNPLIKDKMSRLVGKPTICIGENKGADQLRGNREADQRLCFRHSDSTIPLLLKSEISSVGPVRKPHCWFSHVAAHLSKLTS